MKLDNDGYPDLPKEPTVTVTSKEEICQCPVCGRLHRYLANNPPRRAVIPLSERTRLARVFYETMRAGYEYRQRRWKPPWDKLSLDTQAIFSDAAGTMVDEFEKGYLKNAKPLETPDKNRD